VTPTVGIRVQL